MATFWSTQTICVMFSNGGGNTCAWTLDANRAALVINAVAQTRRARAAASWRDFDGGRPGRERVVLRRAATPQRRSARAIAIGPITFSFHLSNQTAACLSHAGRPSQAQLLAPCSGCALPHETVRPCVNGSTPLRRSDVMSGRPMGRNLTPSAVSCGSHGFPERPLPTDDVYFDCNTVRSIAEPTETQP